MRPSPKPDQASDNGNARKIAPYIRGVAREAMARELAQRIVVGAQPPLLAASEMGLTRDQVYKVMRGPAYKRESTELFALVGDEKKGVVAEATRRLCELLPKAVDTTGRILEESTDDAVALRAANSVFERTGLSAQGRSQDAQTQAILVLNEEQSAALLDALRVARARPVIEAAGRKEQDEEEDEDDEDGETEDNGHDTKDDKDTKDEEDEEDEENKKP
jgi:hypothetical protein